ncbi:MAG: hypothetical protein ABIY48_12585 [Acidimicrobiales bacterium]
MAAHMAPRDRVRTWGALLVAMGVALAVFGLIDTHPGSDVAPGGDPGHLAVSSPTVLGSVVTAAPVAPAADAASPATFAPAVARSVTVAGRNAASPRPTRGDSPVTTGATTSSTAGSTTTPPTIAPPLTIENTTTTTDPGTSSTSTTESTTTSEATTTTGP